MINNDIIEAFSALAKEKDIDRTNLSTIIEDIFMTLIVKKYGEERENFSVIVNMEKGEIEIYQEMTVVDKVIDPIEEIHIDDAIKEYDDLTVGDAFVKILNHFPHLVKDLNQYPNKPPENHPLVDLNLLRLW